MKHYIKLTGTIDLQDYWLVVIVDEGEYTLTDDVWEAEPFDSWAAANFEYQRLPGWLQNQFNITLIRL